MSIQVKSNFNPKRMAEELKERQEKALARAMETAAREIQKRTQSGQDAAGSPFKKYSDAYRKFKQKKGRTGNVDLTFTGDMLRAMSTTVERVASGLIGTIKFNSADAATKAKANMKRRKFFELSREQIEKITNAIRNAK